jgi:hypothetical protein
MWCYRSVPQGGPFVTPAGPTGEIIMTSQASALRTSEFDLRNAKSVDLFSSYRLGDIALDNRLVMWPMTRSRALDGNVPNPVAKTYYVQRASAGLIITEATQVSRRVSATSARRAFIRLSRSPAGERSQRPCTALAERSLPSCGTSAASRTPISTAANCPSHRRRLPRTANFHDAGKSQDGDATGIGDQ